MAMNKTTVTYHNRVDGSNSRTGKYCNYNFKDHGHVNGYPIPF